MYSQSEEEKYIVEACATIPRIDQKPLRFLDIGAFDAKVFSNIRALYEKGWSGVVIEPSPGPLRDLVREYSLYPNENRVEVISGAVGLEAGLRKIRVTDDAVSGNEQARWDEAGGFYGEVYVAFFTVQQIIYQFGAFDMVSIDTEGSSVDVLKALLEIPMDPRCIVVEHDNRFVELLTAAQAKGYQPAYTSAENVVLVK
jgi:FkbM family methyltransferase